MMTKYIYIMTQNILTRMTYVRKGGSVNKKTEYIRLHIHLNFNFRLNVHKVKRLLG